MRHVFKKKKMLIFISCLIVLFVGSFLIYNSISADDNTVIFESIKLAKLILELRQVHLILMVIIMMTKKQIIIFQKI